MFSDCLLKWMCIPASVCVCKDDSKRMRIRGQLGCRPSVSGDRPGFSKRTKEKQNGEGGGEGSLEGIYVAAF